MKEPIAKPARHFYSFGAFRLHITERELFRGGEPLTLPPKTFDTLLLLLRRNGHMVDKDELMKMLWPDTFVEEDNLVQQVSHLRKALGERPDGGRISRRLRAGAIALPRQSRSPGRGNQRSCGWQPQVQVIEKPSLMAGGAG